MEFARQDPGLWEMANITKLIIMYKRYSSLSKSYNLPSYVHAKYIQIFLTYFSKDGSIKIWNNGKVLVREIIMDRTLTAVCFLNSSG
jgi:hypothetical protein